MPCARLDAAKLSRAAAAIRRRCLAFTLVSGGSYLAQACSSAEILATLYLGALDLGEPERRDAWRTDDPGARVTTRAAYHGAPAPGLDRLFVSCCHYALPVYAALLEAGRLDESAWEHVAEDGWNLDLVASEQSPGYECVSGSLGQTISVAAGVAHARSLRGEWGRTVCLLTDGELDEGQDWECIQAAAHLGLGGLVLVIDVNGQQAEGWTDDVVALEPLDERLRAFGCDVVRVDGHDVAALWEALAAPAGDRPRAILCATRPDRGVPAMRDLVPVHFVHVDDGSRPSLEASLALLEEGGPDALRA